MRSAPAWKCRFRAGPTFRLATSLHTLHTQLNFRHAMGLRQSREDVVNLERFATWSFLREGLLRATSPAQENGTRAIERS